jgi:DNA-directed RNA polymerase specialized sigma subunit
MSTPGEQEDVAGLVAAYHLLSGQIAQHQIEIAGLRHKQALLMGLMHQSGLAYRQLAPMLGISKSRVHQLSGATALGGEHGDDRDHDS